MNRTRDHTSEIGWMSGDSGASLVEYTLLLTLIAIVCLAALTAFGSTNSDSVDNSVSRIITAQGGTYP